MTKSININITSIITILLIFACLRCHRNQTADNMIKCLKQYPVDTCEKIHKGV